MTYHIPTPGKVIVRRARPGMTHAVLAKRRGGWRVEALAGSRLAAVTRAQRIVARAGLLIMPVPAPGRG